MFRMSDDEFEALVEEAVELLPKRFLKALDNVAIAWEDEPDADALDLAEYGTTDEGSGDLLGLYDGLAITERGVGYGEGGMDLPDFITIFKGPHERCCSSRAEMVEQVRITVAHEIGHYYGLDEDDLDAIGLA